RSMSPGVSQPVEVVPVQNEAELVQALAIREVVFIEEQHVPESLEKDTEDARAFHVLALQAGHAVGTGRLVELPGQPEGEVGQWGQIGRMAVLLSHRRSGVGSMLLTALETEAGRRGLQGTLLHAQLAALEFYQRHGYQAHGPVFEEAGLPHLMMKKVLA